MKHFVTCIDNKENPASLILGKSYRRIPDKYAEVFGMIRILDEDSLDEDIQENAGYLFPKEWFK
jgi:hypothetical protein